MNSSDSPFDLKVAQAKAAEFRNPNYPLLDNFLAALTGNNFADISTGDFFRRTAVELTVSRNPQEVEKVFKQVLESLEVESEPSPHLIEARRIGLAIREKLLSEIDTDRDILQILAPGLNVEGTVASELKQSKPLNLSAFVPENRQRIQQERVTTVVPFLVKTLNHLRSYSFSHNDFQVKYERKSQNLSVYNSQGDKILDASRDRSSGIYITNSDAVTLDELTIEMFESFYQEQISLVESLQASAPQFVNAFDKYSQNDIVQPHSVASAKSVSSQR